MFINNYNVFFEPGRQNCSLWTAAGSNRAFLFGPFAQIIDLSGGPRLSIQSICVK